MDVASEPSYVHGASPVPLLGETIGQNLDRTAARVPDNDALVSVHQGVRLTYAQFSAAVEEVARGLLALGVEPGERVGIWSPNNAEWVTLQYATAKAGAILVNINPAYRTSELAYALGQSGVSTLVLAPALPAGRLPGHARPRWPATCPRWSGGWSWAGLAGRGDGLGRAALGAGRVPLERLREREALLQFDDPINIQYTSGTTGFPKGATLSHHNILNNGFFVGEGSSFTDRSGLHPGTAVPLLRHGPGQPGLHHPRRGHDLPGRGFDPAATLEAVQAERCTALYGVPTMFIAELEHPRLRRVRSLSLRTGLMGGSPCPVEVMKQVKADMHMDEIAIFYGMTETSPVSFQTGIDDPLEKQVGTVGQVHPTSRSRSSTPTVGRSCRAAHRASCARAATSHARLLEQCRRHRRGDRPGRLDAHRRPGDDGRRGLREHRRADQGHDHPRRRECLPARDRGVPLPTRPSRTCR